MEFFKQINQNPYHGQYHGKPMLKYHRCVAKSVPGCLSVIRFCHFFLLIFGINFWKIFTKCNPLNPPCQGDFTARVRVKFPSPCRYCFPVEALPVAPVRVPVQIHFLLVLKFPLVQYPLLSSLGPQPQARPLL